MSTQGSSSNYAAWIAGCFAVATTIGTTVGTGLFATAHIDKRLTQEQLQFQIGLNNAALAFRKERAKDFRMKHFEKQLAYLHELCEIVGRVAESPMTAKSGDLQTLQRQSRYQIMLYGDCELRDLALAFCDEAERVASTPVLLIDDRRILGHFGNNIAAKCRILLSREYILDDPDSPCFKMAPTKMLSPTPEPPRVSTKVVGQSGP